MVLFETPREPVCVGPLSCICHACETLLVLLFEGVNQELLRRPFAHQTIFGVHTHLQSHLWATSWAYLLRT